MSTQNTQKQPKPKKDDNSSGEGSSIFSYIITIVLIFAILSLAYSFIMKVTAKSPELPLSQLSHDISSSTVSSLVVKGDSVVVTYKNGDVKETKKETGEALSQTFANFGVTAASLSQVKISVEEESGFGYWVFNFGPVLLPIIFILIFVWFLTRQMRGAGMQALSFGQSKARMIDPDDKSQRVTFKDVAGCKEAKEELVEIVDFLRNPKKFQDIGARIPKGVLLMGQPGTGKTYIARAVAGEARVPFFSISGSEFVEMFVGVGASVTGDTPILVKTTDETKLMPIEKFVDQYYDTEESDIVKPVRQIQTLGFKKLDRHFRGVNNEKYFFGGSFWSSVQGVYRHKVKEIYSIKYNGGEIKTTGDHSIFVRERNMIKSKPAKDLREGDVLVNLPFNVRGAFEAGFGTHHHTRAHDFSELSSDIWLDVYEEKARTLAYALSFALAENETLIQKEIGSQIGVSQATVGNWQRGKYLPRFFSSPTFSKIPEKIKLTEDLMKLLGYYAAEGRTEEYYVDWVFGLHETELHKDCSGLIKKIFNIEPRFEPRPESNSMRIILSSKPLAQFFKKHCGTGSHNKHVPQFIWDLPKKYFLQYLYGYSEGDGYTTKDGKLSITSVSYEHIRELHWLSSMHGIPSGMRKTIIPAGRVINGGKPLPESTAWNLIVGKTAHPFITYEGSANQAKRPIVKSITLEKYDGYVYDLCGCDNEAFFGGEKPLLLHNSRVRDLFQMAKKTAPAIIFVDEIDAVGRIRGVGAGGGNDEREQTLNQILVEMDGFEPNEKVIVMAATNRPDVLDPALLRPGRFDRRVTLDLPDRNDREEILKVHSVKKPFAEDVDLKVIAERTPGFSGADLYSLMNEGAILAARENRTKVSQYDLIRSIEKVMLGPERKSHILSKKEKEITAYHEAGHALLSSLLPYADPVHKISIIARGRAGGYVLKLPLEDRKLQSRKEFLDDIAVSLGGYVTEQMLFDDLTTGPSNDLQVSTALAREMVTKYGMSDKLGPVALEGQEGKVLFGRGVEEKSFSEKVAADIDAEVSRIMTEALTKAKQIITDNRKLLDIIAKTLIEKETIERTEFEQLLLAHGVALKKKMDIEHVG